MRVLLKNGIFVFTTLTLSFFLNCKDPDAIDTELKIVDMDVLTLPSYEENINAEVYCLTKLVGFRVKKSNEGNEVQMNFTIDLITSRMDTLKSFEVVDTLIAQKEKFDNVLMIELYLQLDSTFKEGKYLLRLNATDKLSGRSSTFTKEFEI